MAEWLGALDSKSSMQQFHIEGSNLATPLIDSTRHMSNTILIYSRMANTSPLSG